MPFHPVSRSMRVVLVAVLGVTVLLLLAVLITLSSTPAVLTVGQAPTPEGSPVSPESAALTGKLLDRAEKNLEIVRGKVALLVRNIAIAGSIKETNLPADFETYRNEELGFSFAYPRRWGSVKMEVSRTCGPDADYGFHGSIPETPPLRLNFGATIKACVARGGGILDALWKQEILDDVKDPPSEILQLDGGWKMRIWYALWTWWDTEDQLYYEMAASAPLPNSDFSGIGFLGPLMTDEQTSPEDIRDFLLLIRSFRLLR